MISWIISATPGDQLPYFRGSWIVQKDGTRNEVGQVAWKAYVLGLASLVQERLGDRDYSYIMQRTSEMGRREEMVAAYAEFAKIEP